MATSSNGTSGELQDNIIPNSALHNLPSRAFLNLIPFSHRPWRGGVPGHRQDGLVDLLSNDYGL